MIFATGYFPTGYFPTGYFGVVSPRVDATPPDLSGTTVSRLGDLSGTTVSRSIDLSGTTLGSATSSG